MRVSQLALAPLPSGRFPVQYLPAVEYGSELAMSESFADKTTSDHMLERSASMAPALTRSLKTTVARRL